MGFRDAWRALIHGAPTEQRVSRTGPVVFFSSGGDSTAYTPRNYEGYAREGYTQNIIVYRAINEVARGAASVPWRLVRIEGDETVTIEQSPLIDLVNQPNPMQGRSEFVESVMGYWLISGNSYMEAVAPGLGETQAGPGRPPNELWSLRPDKMEIIKSPTGMPAGYVFKDGGRRTGWAADPVSGASPIRHLKFFHPLDYWYGLSPIEAAAMDVDQHTGAAKWNLGMTARNMRPSGALIYEPKEGTAQLDDVQFGQLKSEIDEQSAVATERGRPMLLQGGLKWQEMSISPKDMDWLNGKHASARNIAQAFGVPPQLLGIPGDSTYSNYQEARLALWEETIIPLLWHFRDELNAWLVPMFGDTTQRLEPVLDDVPALIPRREKRWDMTMDAVKAGVISPDEARERIGYSPRGGSADDLWMPATMVPITGTDGESGDDEEGPTEAERAEQLQQEAYGDGPGPRLVRSGTAD